MRKFSSQKFEPPNYVQHVAGGNSVQVAHVQQVQVNNGGGTLPISGIYHNGTWYNAQTLNFPTYESQQEVEMEEEQEEVGERGGGGEGQQANDGIEYNSNTDATLNNSQVYTYSNYMGQQSTAVVNEPPQTFYYQPYNHATQLGGNPTQYEYQPYSQQIIQTVPIPQQQQQELQMGATYYQPYEIQPYTYQVPELPTQPQPQMQLQLQQVHLMPPPQQQQQQHHVTHQAVTPTIISVDALRDLCDPSIIEIDISSASEVYITRTPIKLIITIYRQRSTDKPDMTQKVSINGQPLNDLNFKVNPETESHQNGDQENWEEPKSQTEQDTWNNDTIEENLEICEFQDMLEVPENCSALVEPSQLKASENRSTSVESFELEASENHKMHAEPLKLKPPEICTISVESSELKAPENRTASVESFPLKALENHQIPVEPLQPKATEIRTTSVESSEFKIPKNRATSIESAQMPKAGENRKTSVEQLTPGFKAFNVINPSTLLEYSAQTTDRKSKQEEVVVIEMEKNAKHFSNMEPTKPTKEMEQFRAPRRIVNHQSIEHNLFKLDAIRADGKCDTNNNNNNNNHSKIVEVVRLLSTKSKTHNADHATQENLRSMRKFPAPEDSAMIPPQTSKFAQENAKIKIQKRAERENTNHSEEKSELKNSKVTAEENEPKTINFEVKESSEIVVAHASDITEDFLPDACPIEESKLAQVILGKVPLDSHSIYVDKPKISSTIVNSTVLEASKRESQLQSNLATLKETMCVKPGTENISKPRTFKEIISKALAQPTVRKPKAVKKQVIFSTSIPITPENPGGSSSFKQKIIQPTATPNISKDRLTPASQSNINQIQTNQENFKIPTASNVYSYKPEQASQSNINQTTISQEILKTSAAPFNSEDKTTHASQSHINQATSRQDIFKTTTASNISIVKPVQAFQSTVNQTTTCQDILKTTTDPKTSNISIDKPYQSAINQETTRQDIFKITAVTETPIISIGKPFQSTVNQGTINQDILKTTTAAKTPIIPIDKPVPALQSSINQATTSQDIFKELSASEIISIDKSIHSTVNQANNALKVISIDKPVQSNVNQATTASKEVSVAQLLQQQDISKATTASKIVSLDKPFQSTVSQATTATKIISIDKPIQSNINKATTASKEVSVAQLLPQQDIFKATTASKIISIDKPIQSTVNQATTASKEASREQVAKKPGNSKHTPKSAPKQKRGKIDALILESIPKEAETIQPFGNNQQRNSKKQNSKLSKLERKAIRREVKQSQIGQLQVTDKMEEKEIVKPEEKKSINNQSKEQQFKDKLSDEKQKDEQKSEAGKKDKADGSVEDSVSSVDSQIVCPLLKAVQDAQLRCTLVRIIKKINCL